MRLPAGIFRSASDLRNRLRDLLSVRERITNTHVAGAVLLSHGCHLALDLAASYANIKFQWRLGWSSSTRSTGSSLTRRPTSPADGTAKPRDAVRAVPKSTGGRS